MNPVPVETTPGCFGAASVFDVHDHVCQTCVAHRACGEQANNNLETMRSRIDVSEVLVHLAQTRPPAKPGSKAPRGRRSGVAAASKQALPPALAMPPPAVCEKDLQIIAFIRQQNSKAGEQAQTLCKHNKMNLCRTALPLRVNPFAQSGPSFMRVACELLLNGGFTKALLKQRLMLVLGWSSGTAASHVAMAAVLLYGFGIATLTYETFVLHPDLMPPE